MANKLDQCPDVFGEVDGCPPPQPELGLTELSNQNYVFTRIYQEPLSSPEQVTSVEEVIEHVTYYDGLGRPMQQVAIRAAGDGSDLVTPIVYDAYGRQTRNYLAAPVDDGSPGSFRTTDMPAEVASYYHATFSEDFAGMAPSLANPYSDAEELIRGRLWAAGVFTYGVVCL